MLIWISIAMACLQSAVAKKVTYIEPGNNNASYCSLGCHEPNTSSESELFTVDIECGCASDLSIRCGVIIWSFWIPECGLGTDRVLGL